MSACDKDLLLRKETRQEAKTRRTRRKASLTFSLASNCNHPSYSVEDGDGFSTTRRVSPPTKPPKGITFPSSQSFQVFHTPATFVVVLRRVRLPVNLPNVSWPRRRVVDSLQSLRRFLLLLCEYCNWVISCIFQTSRGYRPLLLLRN